MQGNGFKIGVIALFFGLSVWYLLPTIQWNLENRAMNDMTESEREQYLVDEADKLQNIEENVLNLGLDLQGGMYVTMEVGTPQLVLELAGDEADSTLRNVIQEARARSLENDTDFIDEMVIAYEQRDANARLSRYYRSDTDNITRRSSNQEISLWLKTQRDGAIDRAIEIVRNRVDRFGVTEPSIVKQGNDRLVVELPGVEDEERVVNLLKGTARLEFRLAADAVDFSNFRQQAFSYYIQEADTTDSLNPGQPSNALGEVLALFQDQTPYIFGYATTADTSVVMDLLSDPEVLSMFPRNTTVMWDTRGQQFESGAEYFALYGVNTQAELTGEVIDEASVQFDPATNVPEVAMGMNNEGALKWSRITGANINKPVAITLDGYVVSYPTVNGKISGGNSSITGMANVEEAQDLVNILLSGALPAPLNIIEQRTVGASLGEASIQSGLRSVLVGLGLVAIFMIIYYRKGGAVADLALILNILFIFGILAGFKATLTLPGIAGIVLTIGMAVDANVLIFDRIREEKRGGKTMKASIEAGYANAMSAIIDANVTTFFVAFILFTFGAGPIKGFAVTLMAGIVASLVSAIIITRLVVDYTTRNDANAIDFG
ncbi:MAG: protein translocase subunit SecD [Bacteroidota bacterium]